MLKRFMGLTSALLLLTLCIGGAAPARAEDGLGSPMASRGQAIYLAQLGQAAQSAANQRTQQACYDTCNTRCDADYKACSLNGKAPQLVVNSTCTPKRSECSTKCTSSCMK